jgi:hypothetical protein
LTKFKTRASKPDWYIAAVSIIRGSWKPILKEAGREILFQSHSLIVPSGSLEAEPSNKVLSIGKLLTWPGPGPEAYKAAPSLQNAIEFFRYSTHHYFSFITQASLSP